MPPPENLHLTLAFLGNLDDRGVEEAAGAVTAAAVKIPGWSLEWGGAGAFPSLARPRVLWMGPADAGPATAAAEKLGEELRARDLPVEERLFRPHVTVARVRSGLRREVEESLGALLKRRPHLPAARVQNLVLYSSKLGRGPAVYSALATARLPPGEG